MNGKKKIIVTQYLSVHSGFIALVSVQRYVEIKGKVVHNIGKTVQTFNDILIHRLRT